ncbi:hypothetical protein F0562_029225 [Nyssa sinensis]|uniref:Protein kinase domain-containing protein n=1 Tax=Nyssa sinensis TaxID=561372 RepID=A0A5J5B4J7_9ASTE|nr:hypothetical protein F0562_029225 [Nyssa sinensis]
MNLNSIMTGLSRLFLFAFLGGFALTMVVHALQDKPADAGFIDSGVSKTISPTFMSVALAQQFFNVRSFPEGNRNCYTLRPAKVTGNTYLIRAWFMNENYDAKNQLPQFQMHIGVDFWATVTLGDSSSYEIREIIHVPPKDYINVYLVNIGYGTPFTTALELRPLNKSMYETQYGSLNVVGRYDMGLTSRQFVRYKDDIYDRIWSYSNLDGTTKISGSSTFPAEYIDSFTHPPHIVMSANTPTASDSLYFSWVPDNPTDQFHIYLHFTEVQVLKANESRAFLIYLNGELWSSEPVIPSNLTTTIYGSKSAPKFELSIYKTSNSTLPPIINAIELYNVRQLNSPTDEKDGQTSYNRLPYKNLTSLIGYCNEGSNIGIIYEFMANGDLRSHLSDRNPKVLMWEDRLRIAVDAAQGLDYLHHGCKPPIIHRDVKCANILLKEKFQAKLADFGLSRVFPAEGDTHVSTKVVGTPGYLDPDFGIVLLEIITNCPVISKGPNKTRISQWVRSKIENGDIENIVDPRLRGDFDVNSVWKAVELAMACVSHTSTKRPTMNCVVNELQECLATKITCHEMELKDPIGVISMNVESEVLVPLAR